jgi:S1-C subfamily serine protease
MMALGKVGDDEYIDFMGAKIKKLTTPGERSATGMDGTRGVLVVEVKAGSEASGFLQANDVILSFNNRTVNKLHDLSEARMSVIGTNTEVVVFRNQKEVKRRIELGSKN